MKTQDLCNILTETELQFIHESMQDYVLQDYTGEEDLIVAQTISLKMYNFRNGTSITFEEHYGIN